MTISRGPSPAVRYATDTSPLRAYWPGGICTSASLDMPDAEVGGWRAAFYTKIDLSLPVLRWAWSPSGRTFWLVVRRARDYRAWYFVGAATVIAVAAWEILRAPIPPALLRAEVGLFGLGIVYAIAMIMFRWQHINELATTCVNVALAGAILAVAAPYLADPLPFSFGVLAITVLPSIVGGESQARSWSHPMSATICGVFAMVAVWLRLGGFSIGVTEIVVWGGLLTGFGALAQVHWRLAQFRVEHRLEQLELLARQA